MPYNFDLNQAYIKQESTINSILESRLVPRDLDGFDTFEGSKTEAYVYVDNNGKENKLSLYDIFDGKISTVTDLPKTAEEGQLVLHKIGENKYTLETFENGKWKILELRSTAEMITLKPTEYIDVSNVQSAIENLDSRVHTITEGSVHSINELVGDVELKGGINIVISSSDNSITIQAPDVETHEEAEQLKSYLEEYADQSEQDAKDYAYEIDQATNKKFDDEVARLDERDISLDERITSEVETLNTRIDGEVETLNSRIDDEVVDLNARINHEVETLNSTIDAVSDDVYHKDVIKNIALTGEAKDVYVNDLHDVYSNDLQEVLSQINNKAETGGSIATISLEKLDTPEEGNLESYKLVFNGLQAGVNVNIPKDYVIKSLSLEICTENDVPIEGLLEKEYYLDVVVNTRDNSVEDKHIYCSLSKINDELNLKANIDDLATVAYTGSYNNLEDKLQAGSGVEIIVDSEGRNVINNTNMEAIWGNIRGSIENQSDLNTELTNIKSSIATEESQRIEADELIRQDISERIDVKMAEMEEKLATERQERMSSDIELNNSLEEESSTREQQDLELTNKLNELDGKINEEISSRETSDESLRNDLDAEIERATNYEQVLYEYIDSEGNRAMFVEGLLSQEITDEETRAKEAEQLLDEKINTEISSREGEITRLEEKIDTSTVNLSEAIEEESTRAKEAERLNAESILDEVSRATEAEQQLYEYIDSEGNRAVIAEALLSQGLDDEILRATTKENSLQSEVDQLNTDINKVVVTDVSVGDQYPDKVLINTSKVNIKTGATSVIEDNLPLANQTNAGLMSPSDVKAIEDLNDRVESLEGTTRRLLYTDKENPTASEIETFVEGLGYEKPFSGISVVVENTLHIWHYYSNEESWKDDGVDTVTDFSNEHSGTIKGSLDVGKVYAENDGTGSVNGWSQLTSRVTNLETNSATKTELSEETLARTTADTNLQSNIDTLSQSVTTRLQAEATARADEDSNLNSLIGTEATARESADETLQDNIDTVSGNLSTHISNKSNPHEVTKAQIGLGNVVNTSDSDTPVSGGTTKFTTGGAYTELNKKVDKVTNKSLIDDSEITRLTNIASGANKVAKGTNNGDVAITTRTNGTESTAQVNVYTHPTYQSHTAAAVKVGNDTTGHVVIGDQLTGADVGVTATETSVTVDGTTFNKYVHPAGDSHDVELKKLYKFTTDSTSHISSVEEVSGSDIVSLSPYATGPGLTSVVDDGQTYFKSTYTTVSVLAGDWSLDQETNYYKTEITVNGVTADSNPVLDVVINKTYTSTEIDEARESWSMVFSGETTLNTITLYATEAPGNMMIAIKGY